MPSIHPWKTAIATCALFSTTALFTAPMTLAQNETEAAPQAAPAVSLVGQCRAAKQRIFVYAQRSNTSQTLRTIAANEEVTLADNGQGGFIAISAPVTGYVQARDLKGCTGEDNEQPTAGNVCRRVTVAQGLVVRQSPTGNPVGSVFEGNTVRLASPRNSQKDSQGRTWIQITNPRAGWISSGFPEGNLGPTFTCR